jgi:hypothetical protein
MIKKAVKLPLYTAEELHGGCRPMLDAVEEAQRDAAKWMGAKWLGTAALFQREATLLLHLRRSAVAHWAILFQLCILLLSAPRSVLAEATAPAADDDDDKPPPSLLPTSATAARSAIVMSFLSASLTPTFPKPERKATRHHTTRAPLYIDRKYREEVYVLTAMGEKAIQRGTGHLTPFETSHGTQTSFCRMPRVQRTGSDTDSRRAWRQRGQTPR